MSKAQMNEHNFPGPTEAIKSTPDQRLIYYGELNPLKLVGGDALAKLVGLRMGHHQNILTGWMKYRIDGVLCYMAKRTLRYDVSWKILEKLGVVYGERVLKIGDHLYKIRLPRGGNAEVTEATTGFDCTASHGSEWNRLFYHLAGGRLLDPRNVLTSEHGAHPWFPLGDKDFHTHHRTGHGSYSWCIEAHGTSCGARVTRGYHGLSHLGFSDPDIATPDYGWRPVLEPIDSPVLSTDGTLISILNRVVTELRLAKLSPEDQAKFLKDLEDQLHDG